jgi:hypothetical protein
MRGKYLVIGAVLGVLLSSAVVVLAGNLDPPSGPIDAASQMYTLEQIYNRLDTGAVSAKMETFTEPAAGPGRTMHTLDEVMSLAMKVGDPDPPCADNDNRYVDCGNGTVHDTVTNLIWLKDASCLGELDYAAAYNAVAGLEDGECDLTDGSSPGDWRLPTKEEWETTVAQAKVLGCTGAGQNDPPSLTNTAGTGCFSAGPAPFENVGTGYYRSSTANEVGPSVAWQVHLYGGTMSGNLKTLSRYVWPVRDGP